MAWILIDPACHGASVPIVHPRVVGVVSLVDHNDGAKVLLTHCKKSNGKRSYIDTLYAVPDEVFW
jgi:hypothetical protein